VLARNRVEVLDLGLQGYGLTLEKQRDLVKSVQAGEAPDHLILVEHHPVITIGLRGTDTDLLATEDFFRKKGVELYRVERGGKATYHGPGQLVAYPILKLQVKDLHLYVQTLLGSFAALLSEYGLEPELKKGEPGLWVRGQKIASLGVAVKKWVTYHGVALNVNTDLEPFSWIVPCGKPSEKITSMQKELGRPLDLARIKQRFVTLFRSYFGYPEDDQAGKPSWLTMASPDFAAVERMKDLLGTQKLSTVCQSARCPNLGECFGRGTATFMILGARCTRGCRFCAVEKGVPEPLDPEEPERVAMAAERLGLKYVVVTSVTRDDLADGGAEQFARTIRCIRKQSPHASVEVLIPDFKGDRKALETVFEAGPDMLNHNIETVPRLYKAVRPQAEYRRSLDVLKGAADFGLRVKSGLMLGLGERPEEVRETLQDLREAGCEYLTMGQYLAPSADHVPVARYLTPREFADYAREARSLGFEEVSAGPLVRSSYRAEKMAGCDLGAA
jgi:lipoic acid synthetase